MQSFDFTGDQRVVTILGSNTNVGKTLVSLALSCAFLKKNQKIQYIKPWQTGYPTDSDERSIAEQLQLIFGQKVVSNLWSGVTFSKHKTAVSPHLAAKKEGHFQSDKEVLSQIVSCIEKCESNTWVLVEGAGGVLSPTGQGTPQIDALRKIRCPVILVGDARLGGISNTLAALESLHIRGFDVWCVLMEAGELENDEYLEELLKSHFSKPVPLFRFPSFQVLQKSLGSWLEQGSEVFERVSGFLQDAHRDAKSEIQTLKVQGLNSVWWPFTQHSLFEGNLPQKKPDVLKSAQGDWICAAGGKNFHDANASWWTQCLGHGDSGLARSAAYAAGRYGHVMYPENFTEATVNLCQKLLKVSGGNWASKVFLSDNGSTAVEVGLKMAFRLFEARRNKGPVSSLKVLALKDTYHGDTLGAMDAVAPSSFNAREPWYSGRGVFLDYPVVFQKLKSQRTAGEKSVGNVFAQEGQGPAEWLEWVVQWKDKEFILERDPFDAQEEVFLSNGTGFAAHQNDGQSKGGSGGGNIGGSNGGSGVQPLGSSATNTLNTLKELKSDYERYLNEVMEKCIADGENIACLVLEPLVHGSGGMSLIHPMYQRTLIDVARAHRLPLLFDEVFEGLWRLGKASARETLKRDPDIACYSKCLTGGLMALGATVSTQEVFDSFLGDDKKSALLHGHSYSGNPMACTVAFESLSRLEKLVELKNLEQTPEVSGFSEGFVSLALASGRVEWAWAKGLVFAAKLSGVGSTESAKQGYHATLGSALCESLKSQNVFARPLGDIVYLMTGHKSEKEDVKFVEEKFLKCLAEL